MKRGLTIFLLLFILPAAVLAEDGIPAGPEVLGTSTSTVSQDQIYSGRALLSQYLSAYLGPDGASKFLNDPRLYLDTSLAPANYATSTGTGFNYFSDSFGLVSDSAVKDGLSYRSKHWAHFKKARARYGVDSYYILGILRLETYFGASAGKRSLPSTLYSIFVLNPARRNFAWKELAVFLELAKRNKIDAFAVKSSSAGAYGIPQFIPSSVYNFAVDGNGDGKVNLFNNADAILSVANYLHQNGWAGGANKSRAIYSYNHDNGYVRAVLAYGDAVKDIVEKQ